MSHLAGLGLSLIDAAPWCDGCGEDIDSRKAEITEGLKERWVSEVQWDVTCDCDALNARLRVAPFSFFGERPWHYHQLPEGSDPRNTGYGEDSRCGSRSVSWMTMIHLKTAQDTQLLQLHVIGQWLLAMSRVTPGRTLRASQEGTSRGVKATSASQMNRRTRCCPTGSKLRNACETLIASPAGKARRAAGRQTSRPRREQAGGVVGISSRI